MRWLWIDRFLEFRSGRSAVAVKNLSLAEDHFADHLPGHPVMPASLILEGLAQAGGILAGEARQYREKVVLAKISNARFHAEATPGQQLRYEVELLQISDAGAAVAGKVKAGERLLAEAEITFAHLDQNRAKQMFGERNFVFSGELQSLLGLAQAAARDSLPARPAQPARPALISPESAGN